MRISLITMGKITVLHYRNIFCIEAPEDRTFSASYGSPVSGRREVFTRRLSIIEPAFGPAGPLDWGA
jgi:hypothetical protein